jgi:hypothetical protein
MFSIIISAVLGNEVTWCEILQKVPNGTRRSAAFPSWTISYSANRVRGETHARHSCAVCTVEEETQKPKAHGAVCNGQYSKKLHTGYAKNRIKSQT